MSRYDLIERLSRMVQDAEKQASAKQQAITRRAAANGMLGSGNFFIDSKSSLEQTFADALKNMAEYALSLVAPRVAATLIKRSGEDLESKFISRFQNILEGKISGRSYPGGGAGLLNEFSATLRQTLINTAIDAAHNFDKGHSHARGVRAFLLRNGWKIITACIAIAGLILSWAKI